MATAYGAASIQLVDATGVPGSFDIPFSYDTATATLAGIISWLSTLSLKVDAVTEGKVNKIRFTLTVPLPGGLKAAAISNSDLEETGLFSFNATGTPNRYGSDVPAFMQSKFTGGNVNTSDADVASFVAFLTTPAATGAMVGTDRYGNPLIGGAYTARKTFRKRRRALRRA